jgi:hypothetical protein
MKKYTHFDLEDAIYKVWQTADDIETLYKYHGDAEQPMTEDEVANALIGLKQLHDMRCWQLMDMSARVFELNQYCTDPVKLAAREKMLSNVDVLLNPDFPFKQKKKGSKK